MALEGLAAAAEAYQLARGGLGALSFLRSVRGSGVIATYFDERGERVAGDKRLEIVKHPGRSQAEWWFEVRSPDGYVCVRYPLIESAVFELITNRLDQKNPDARYWRWIAPTRPGTFGSAEIPNVLVPFLIVGYKPKALVSYFREAHRNGK